jgi:hypothetical protein
MGNIGDWGIETDIPQKVKWGKCEKDGLLYWDFRSDSNSGQVFFFNPVIIGV